MRWRWGGSALAGCAAILVAIAIAWAWRAGHRPAPARSTAVAVVSAPAAPPPSDRIPIAERAPAPAPVNQVAPNPSLDQLDALADRVNRLVAGADEDVRALHTAVAAAPRDDASARAESRMVTAMPAGIGTAITSEALQARCSNEVCELAGEASGDPEDIRRDVGNAHWRDTLPRLGYAPGPVLVGRSDGRTVFVVYVRRLS